MALTQRWRLIDRPLKTQFLIASGWVVLWFALSGGVQAFLMHRQAAASQALLQAHSAVSGLILLQRDFYRQQSAIFAFLETGEARFLSYIDSGKAVWKERAGSLRGGFAPGSAEEGKFDQLQLKYRDWEALTGGFVAKHREGRSDLVAGDAEREASISREIFSGIETLVEAEKSAALRWGAEEGATRRASFSAMIASSLALLAFLAYILIRLYRSIARPVASLSASMARYQNGELGNRVEVTSRSEIGYLQGSFNQTAETIEEMVRDLRNLDEMKNEFISTVSHELKTPLTSIGGFTRLLAQGDAGPVNDTQKEFLGIVETNVKRLTELISDLLDMERMQSGRIPLTRERIDLRGILEECRNMFRILAAEKGLELTVNVPDREIAVRGDRARLLQVFTNLFSNAVKYTEKGSVDITVELQSFAVVVKVKDSGIGIPEAEQGRLFEKFYRASSARSSAEGGTGLGLVIVKSLVEAHGGRISLSSRPGEGTVMTVILPLDAPEAASGIPSGEAAPAKAVSGLRELWFVDPEDRLRPGQVEALRRIIEREAAAWDFRPVLRFFRSARELPTRGSDPALIASVGAGNDSLPILAPILELDAARLDEFGSAASTVLARGARRILVADASDEIREQVRRSLEVLGYRVDEAGAGSAVLKKIGRERYDLVIVDPEFADMKPAELLSSIRNARPGGGSVPVMVLLDQSRSAPSRDALVRLGADQFVGKFEGVGGVADAVADFFEGARR